MFCKLTDHHVIFMLQLVLLASKSQSDDFSSLVSAPKSTGLAQDSCVWLEL